jgi:uncharacterized protein (UPF0332 family)
MINPSDLIALAEKLAQGALESEWRGGVSRGYYGAFHAGCQLLEALQFQTPQGGSAHAYVLHRLANCGEPAIERAGQDLRQLQSARNKADYRLAQDVSQQQAQLWVVVARSLLPILAAALVEPTRSQVTAAIRDYERNVLGRVTWQGP